MIFVQFVIIFFATKKPWGNSSRRLIIRVCQHVWVTNYGERWSATLYFRYSSETTCLKVNKLGNSISFVCLSLLFFHSSITSVVYTDSCIVTSRPTYNILGKNVRSNLNKLKLRADYCNNFF